MVDDETVELVDERILFYVCLFVCFNKESIRNDFLFNSPTNLRKGKTIKQGQHLKIKTEKIQNKKKKKKTNK